MRFLASLKGRERGRQVRNQTFDPREGRGNAALRANMIEGLSVRVIRSIDRKLSQDSEAKYRYDGLFRVEEALREKGLNGHLVCRFKLVKLATEEVLSIDAPKDEDFVEPPLPEGNLQPVQTEVMLQRVIRSTAIANSVKQLHDHRCQICGLRLAAGERGYSEVAHIQALSRGGPDIMANVLCLCANCHVLFDLGALLVEDDFSITRNGESADKLLTHPRHIVNPKYLRKHREAYS
ncbi:YDG/SRA domain-containing protein [Amycolatopsis sp. H20-H5]|uniref:YDG/SRA domain-containing protein n=1 Tax=Amycolatopsis sp. H20-H5 TaxID=3046309 RepID=UPI002DB5D4E7|nr:YDG/SRA domain-containing protein [Amycolatopsis sp. H20-H5]MEC3982787.1 YDG/SRA domain-containing protein [Amycolatopsis sp. H20-H5]